MSREKEKKLSEVSVEGQTGANVHKSHQCNYCGKEATAKSGIKVCSGCHSVKYCNERCQKKHRKSHRVLCQAIKTLSNKEEENCRDKCSFVSHVPPTVLETLVSLVGKRCVVKCKIGGCDEECLYDTGSQVSLIDDHWLQQYCPRAEIFSISSLIGGNLDIQGVGGHQIPYKGYVFLTLEIGGFVLNVPFLVAKERLCQPIIGFNTISAIVNEPDFDYTRSMPNLKQNFPSLSEENVECFVNLIRGLDDSECLAQVTTYKEGPVIRAGASISIPCKIDGFVADKRIPCLFEPECNHEFGENLRIHEAVLTVKKGSTRVFITVTNESSRDIKLQGRYRLGDLHLISSITPAEVTFKEKTKGEHLTIAENNKDFKKDNASIDLTNESEFNIQKEQKEDEKSSNLQSGNNEIKSNSVNSSGVKVKSDDHLYSSQFDKLDLSMLDTSQQEEVRKMLWEERSVFAKDEDDIGCVPDLELSLKTVDNIPVQKVYNAIPRAFFDEVKHHVQDLLNRGWIMESKSAWSSPVVLVRKKDGGLRMCCDFRSLNAKTIPDKFPIPRIQETIDGLSGSKHFTTLDLTRAYYQGFVAEDSQEKTAFCTPWGLYSWKRIPFGLCNAPSVFQRHMENTLRDFRDDFCVPYIDDIIVYSKTFEEHIHHLQKVLKRLKDKGMKLKLEKCNFFKKKVEFLGRVVCENGYTMSDKSVQAVRELAKVSPKNVGQVRQLLGLVNYHRRSIQDFTVLAKPISDILLAENTKKIQIIIRRLQTLLKRITSNLLCGNKNTKKLYRLSLIT